MLKSAVFFAILDDETRATEETVPSTDDAVIAKDDDNSTARNLAEEENSFVQPNGDIEMEDDNADRNIQLPTDVGQEILTSAETNANDKESASLPIAKESVEPEDIEMENTETTGLDNTNSIPHPEIERRDINETTEENDLLGSVKDLPPNEGGEELVTASPSQDTPLSEALHQEEPQETVPLVEGPTKTVPGENEPGENQNAEMETEQ